jgi:hypothetical protein
MRDLAYTNDCKSVFAHKRAEKKPSSDALYCIKSEVVKKKPSPVIAVAYTKASTKLKF